MKMSLIIPLLYEKKKRKKPKLVLVGLGLHGVHTTAINSGSTNIYFCFSTVKKMISCFLIELIADGQV